MSFEGDDRSLVYRVNGKSFRVYHWVYEDRPTRVCVYLVDDDEFLIEDLLEWRGVVGRSSPALMKSLGVFHEVVALLQEITGVEGTEL